MFLLHPRIVPCPSSSPPLPPQALVVRNSGPLSLGLFFSTLLPVRKKRVFVTTKKKNRKDASNRKSVAGGGERAHLPRALVFAVEGGRRWSDVTAAFCCALAKARTETRPLVKQSRTESAWFTRWSAPLWLAAAAMAFSMSLLKGRGLRPGARTSPQLQRGVFHSSTLHRLEMETQRKNTCKNEKFIFNNQWKPWKHMDLIPSEDMEKSRINTVHHEGVKQGE